MSTWSRRGNCPLVRELLMLILETAVKSNDGSQMRGDMWCEMWCEITYPGYHASHTMWCKSNGITKVRRRGVVRDCFGSNVQKDEGGVVTYIRKWGTWFTLCERGQQIYGMSCGDTVRTVHMRWAESCWWSVTHAACSQAWRGGGLLVRRVCSLAGSVDGLVGKMVGTVCTN